MQTHWIYIIECDNGSYYTGYTVDLEARYQAHVSGKCKYTRSFKPVKLARSWRLAIARSLALKIEALIKAQTREFKAKLIERPELLHKLILEKLDIELGDCCGVEHR